MWTSHFLHNGHFSNKSSQVVSHTSQSLLKCKCALLLRASTCSRLHLLSFVRARACACVCTRALYPFLSLASFSSRFLSCALPLSLSRALSSSLSLPLSRIQMRRVTYSWVISHTNESYHMWRSHVTYKWGISQNHESCHEYRRHVICEWVTSHR